MPLQTGQVLNKRYRIAKLLGQGGYGAVYRAWDINFEMACALKENYETSPESQRQFMREAKLLHTLRHNNLPLVKDYFQIPGQGQYLVMDYVEGDDIQAILEKIDGPVDKEQAIEWLVQICKAVEYLHSRIPPVIHRDIKPANIKITPQGNAMLVDFGISKIYDPNLATTKGARAVTPGYAPFEQYGHAPTDERTDIYALGATAYTLLTATVPSESISRMAGIELPKIREINPEISREFEEVVIKAMALMPSERFQSVQEFRKTLENIPEFTTHVQSSQEMARSKVEFQSEKETSVQDVIQKTPPTFSTSISLQKPYISEDSSPKEIQLKGKKNRTWIWIILSLAVISAGLIGGIFAWQAGIFETTNVEEPPPEIPMSEIAGSWVGFMQPFDTDERFPQEIFIDHEPEAHAFGGKAIIVYANHPEEMSIEGEYTGEEVFARLGDLFYRGKFQGDMIAGEFGPDCFECKPVGHFEWHR